MDRNHQSYIISNKIILNEKSNMKLQDQQQNGLGERNEGKHYCGIRESKTEIDRKRRKKIIWQCTILPNIAGQQSFLQRLLTPSAALLLVHFCF